VFDNKTLLITGGTGSFGNAVLRRFLHTGINEIRVFSRDEKKQEDMRIDLNNSKVKFYIGDVRNYDSVLSALQGVDFVFHAAALKQVPSCEFYPMEAVRTNILGTENVLNAALACGVKKVITLSTDKAVYPINAMGISKAMMEKVMVAKARMTQCDSTSSSVPAMAIHGVARFGHPAVRQADQGGETLTSQTPKDPFSMSLDDAVDLVCMPQQCLPGRYFLQKAPPRPFSILHLRSGVVQCG